MIRPVAYAISNTHQLWDRYDSPVRCRATSQRGLQNASTERDKFAGTPQNAAKKAQCWCLYNLFWFWMRTEGSRKSPRIFLFKKLSNSKKEGQQATGSPQCLSAHQQCQNARSEISPDMLHNVLPDTPQCICQCITNNGRYVNTYKFPTTPY